MSKSIIKTNLSRQLENSGGNARKIVPMIAFKLMLVMKNHIGSKNAISRDKLFAKLFAKVEEDTLSDWTRWEFIKKAMSYCRSKTKCYIAGIWNGGSWSYYVVRSMKDAEMFNENLDRAIKGLQQQKRKTLKAVKERWYNKNWEIPEKDQKLLMLE